MKPDLTDLRTALMAAAVEGFYIADIEPWPLKVVRAQVDRMQRDGVLHSAHHGTMVGRTAKYFESAEKAEAFLKVWKKPKPAKAYAVPNMRPITIAKPRVHAWWPADAKPHFTAQTKYTYGASPGRVLRTNTFAE